MSRSTRIILWSLAAVVVLIVVAVAVVVKIVFLPTDCYDHEAVAVLAREPIERVVPNGSQLAERPHDPTCNFIEPRYEEPSRSWVLHVMDPSRVQEVVDDLVASADRHGWVIGVDQSVPNQVVLHRRIDGREAELVISIYEIDAGGATDAAPAGSWNVYLSTTFVRS